jgi:3-oxoacyl-(acyl-carrier-protein) synthase
MAPAIWATREAHVTWGDARLERDPDCDLDYATGGMVERPVWLALSNSFGGHNVGLAVKRFEG